ncbi:hypothetical protein [Aquimarina sp. MMG016]|uniref:hypothetical protein n=1 Tax=Aquimarina sp. MMG016 TaxID=2822690 RepID=UPI001B39DA75|nr:hypothetical protein [Aquimarina sp. MMG016]MBQ4820528.1 hypothetical protein [Aquimarina sp. MMG016]
MKTTFEKLPNSLTRKNHKAGLVLSGGGTKWFVHLVGYKPCTRKKYVRFNIRLSVGDIAGAFLPSVIDPIDITLLMLDYKFFD